MRKELKNANTGGILRLIAEDAELQGVYDSDSTENVLTLAWNDGEKQCVTIDGQKFNCPKNTVIALMSNQSFSFERPEKIVAWQFNRQFYCIVDHDKEVSCSGLLFYGSSTHPFIALDDGEHKKIDLLYQVFIEEFEDRDNLQEDMLRMLLKRLIIKTTRLYKKQTDVYAVPSTELDIVREYNLMVENHFKEWHQVQDFANEMNKSPKTLSNLFSQHHSKSPLKILHERIILEAKRMLIYTDQSIKEIAYDLGFEEVPTFNRLFKKITSSTPSEFRKTVQAA